MPSETLESQLQDIREQLNLQAEAILKIAELVAGLEGIDAASLGSYAVRLQRLRNEPIAAPKPDAPAADPTLSAPEPSPLIQRPGVSAAPGDEPA